MRLGKRKRDGRVTWLPAVYLAPKASRALVIHEVCYFSGPAQVELGLHLFRWLESFDSIPQETESWQTWTRGSCCPCKPLILVRLVALPSHLPYTQGLALAILAYRWPPVEHPRRSIREDRFSRRSHLDGFHAPKRDSSHTLKGQSQPNILPATSTGDS